MRAPALQHSVYEPPLTLASSGAASRVGPEGRADRGLWNQLSQIGPKLGSWSPSVIVTLKLKRKAVNGAGGWHGWLQLCTHLHEQASICAKIPAGSPLPVPCLQA